MKWYVYITDRSDRDSFGFGRRVFTELYEADSKDEVKALVLQDFEGISKVREKMTKTTPEGERFITTIKPMDSYWEGVFLNVHTCIDCQTPYTKLDKLRYQAGGSGEFCSEECQKQHFVKYEAPSSFDSGHVYMITHKPSGQRYVGVTIRWVMQRWWEHMKATTTSPLHKLIQEDGIESFTFEVLAQFKPSEIDPYSIEASYIRDYNAKEAGLNAVDGHKEKILS